MVRQKPVEYRVVSAPGNADIEKEVSALLMKDWILHGPMQVANGQFHQAMVRVELEQMGPPPGADIVVPQRRILG